MSRRYAILLLILAAWMPPLIANAQQSANPPKEITDPDEIVRELGKRQSRFAKIEGWETKGIPEEVVIDAWKDFLSQYPANLKGDADEELRRRANNKLATLGAPGYQIIPGAEDNTAAAQVRRIRKMESAFRNVERWKEQGIPNEVIIKGWQEFLQKHAANLEGETDEGLRVQARLKLHELGALKSDNVIHANNIPAAEAWASITALETSRKSSIELLKHFLQSYPNADEKLYVQARTKLASMGVILEWKFNTSASEAFQTVEALEKSDVSKSVLIKRWKEFITKFSADKNYVKLAEDKLSDTYNVPGYGALVRVFREHTNSVLTVNFSPDGKNFVSGGSGKADTGSKDQSIKLWDVSSSDSLFTLTGHNDSVRAVEYTPDGKYIISASQDKTMRLWNASTGEFLRIFKGVRKRIHTVSISPDGATVLSGGLEPNIYLWNLSNGKVAKTLKWKVQKSFSCSFDNWKHPSADIKNHSGTVYLTPQFRLDGSRKVYQGNSKNIGEGRPLAFTEEVAFSPNGINAVSVGTTWIPEIKKRYCKKLKTNCYRLCNHYDYNIVLWDVLKGSFWALGNHGKQTTAVSFSPDSRTVLSGADDGSIKLWDVSRKKSILTLRGHSGFVEALVFSPNGKMIASGGTDNTVRLWNVNTGNLIRIYKGHSDTVFSVDFSPDGRYVISGSKDRTIRLWDTQR